MAKRGPKYQAFPPGDHIREEIEDRGWTQGDLARIMGRPMQVINEIINGHKAITARTARELEAALGPSAELWMNLETSYRLFKQGQADPEIAVRARQTASSERRLLTKDDPKALVADEAVLNRLRELRAPKSKKKSTV